MQKYQLRNNATDANESGMPCMSDDPKLKHIHGQKPVITRDQRERQNGHKTRIIWFTGLSGAGKSTIAHALEERLYHLGCRTFVFDGDNVRHGLCGDLGFSAADRAENIRRVGEMARLFLESGVIAMTAFISPFRSDRARVRALCAPGEFIEVYCDCAIEVCEQRDVKGLYKLARNGTVKEFTGISSPYEPPEDPELILRTDRYSVEQCVEQVLTLLVDKHRILVAGKHVASLAPIAGNR